MSSAFEWDQRTLDRKLSALPAAMRLPRDQLVKAAGGGALRKIYPFLPHDTNRYKAALAQAGNQAGLGPLPVPPIVASKNHKLWVERLEQQVEKWARRSESFANRMRFLYPHGEPKSGRKGLYRRLQKDLDRAMRIWDRAKEELEKLRAHPDAIVIGQLVSGNAQAGRNLVTVRTPIYGGVGRFQSDAFVSAARLTLKEPHARLVEGRSRVLKTLIEIFHADPLLRDAAEIVRKAAAQVQLRRA